MTESKKRWPWFVLGFFGFLVVVGGSIYFWMPQVLLGFVKIRYESKAGLREDVAIINGYNIPYYEGGEGKPLVLIHGFGDQKLSFLQVAPYLVPHYRLILPEVPGFGATLQDPKLSYSIEAQVQRFHLFFKKLGLKEFYLGGNSMGGHISAAYAIRYPHQVKKLILLNAAGLKAPNAKLPYDLTKRQIHSLQDFRKLFQQLFYKVPSIPRPVEMFLLARAQQNNQWHLRVAKDLRGGSDFLLNDKVGQIKVPTLVLWGDHDRLVDPAIGRLFHKSIKGSQWVLMNKCGHTPQYERPKETSQHLLTFLRK